jgi:hypothetical protein
MTRLVYPAGIWMFIVSVTGILDTARADSLSLPDLPLTAQEQALLIAPSKADQLDWMRDSVRQSRYGQRGLDRIFKNFEGDFYLDPVIPGVEKNIRFLASPSWQQAKGARRTLLFGTAIQNDGRFELLALDEPTMTKLGRTDKDLSFRHTDTGRMCRIEVKDVSLSSQRADIVRIEGQIDKMADDYRRTGDLQAWVNRQGVLPEIEAYARFQGIPVFAECKQSDLGQLLDHFDRLARWKANFRLFGSFVEAGFGAVLIATEGPQAFHDASGVWQSNGSDVESWLRLGRDTSLTGMGATMLTSGAVGVTSRFSGSSVEWLGGVEAFSEWAGPLGLGLYVVADGFDEGVAVWDYRHGTISRQHFISESAGVGTGLGTVSLGAIIGTFIEPGGGTLIGAGIGSLVALPASWGTTHLVDSHYEKLNVSQQEQVRTAVYDHYGVN